MTDFFSNNIKVLKERFPGIKIPSSNYLSSKIKALETPSGATTIKFKSILLHSSYDPLKEATTLAKSISPKNFILL